METSVVDLKNGEMHTETRNLEWEGVLSVVERQSYRPAASPASHGDNEVTDVTTTVKFESRLGSTNKANSWAGSLSNWGAGGVQRSIEVIGVKRMREGLGRSREGMKIVLEGMREKGLMGVMHERRKWKDMAPVEHGGRWDRLWGNKELDD